MCLENNHRLQVRAENHKGLIFTTVLWMDILKHIGIKNVESIIVANDDEIACMKITLLYSRKFSEATVITKTENVNNEDRF